MKRSRLKIFLGSEYSCYCSLEKWLEEVYVHVVSVKFIDGDTLVVLYENA